MSIQKTYICQKYDLNHISWEEPEHRRLEAEAKMADLVRAERQKELNSETNNRN